MDRDMKDSIPQFFRMPYFVERWSSVRCARSRYLDQNFRPDIFRQVGMHLKVVR